MEDPIPWIAEINYPNNQTFWEMYQQFGVVYIKAENDEDSNVAQCPLSWVMV